MLLLEAREIIDSIEQILSLVGVRRRAGLRIRDVSLFLIRWSCKVAFAPQHESMFATQSTNALLGDVEALIVHNRCDFATAEALLP